MNPNSPGDRSVVESDFLRATHILLSVEWVSDETMTMNDIDAQTHIKHTLIALLRLSIHSPTSFIVSASPSGKEFNTATSPMTS